MTLTRKGARAKAAAASAAAAAVFGHKSGDGVTEMGHTQVGRGLSDRNRLGLVSKITLLSSNY